MDKNELIAFAASRGCIITARQLERWHKEDLIPRPEVFPPQTFSSGRRSTYPQHAGPQVLAVCRLYKRKRKADAVRFWLWLEGFSIELSLLKKTIRKLVPVLDLKLPHRPVQKERIAEQQTQTVIQQVMGRAEDKILRAFLQRLHNKADRESMIYIHTSLLYGVRYYFEGRLDETAEELTAAAIISQGLGLEAVRFIPKDITADMDRTSQQGLLSLAKMQGALETATEEELQQACARLEMIGPLFECLDIMGYLVGPLRSYQEYLSDPALQALFLVFLLLLEKHGYSHNMNVIFDAVRTNLPMLRKGQAIHQALQQELPLLFKELFTLQQASHMIIEKPEEFEAYLDRLREVYKQHQTELDAFWQSHPEWFVE